MEFATIDKIVKDFQYAYLSKLVETKHAATGNLAFDQDYEIEFDGQYFRIYFIVNNYWKYLEYGTRGTETGLPGRKFPPVDAIMQWIKIKPILPRPNKKGKLPTDNQLAFLIGRKIQREGTPKTLLMQKTMAEFDFTNKIATAFHDILVNETTKLYDEIL